MEALVMIIAAVMFAPICAMAAAVAGIALAVVDLVGLVLQAVFGIAWSFRRPARGEAAPAPETGRAAAPKGRRRHWLLAPLVALGLISLVVNFVFLEATTRWAVERYAGKSGFAVGFAGVEGSIYSGRFEFTEVTVQRAASTRAGFDLRIGQVAVDVNLWSLIFRPIRLENLTLASISGQITKRARSKSRGGGSGKLKPKRRFLVERLEIRDAKLRIVGDDGTDSEFEVVSASSEPFRSDLAVFDFFFRSSVSARVDGHPVEIVTERLAEGRRTYWDIRDFPVSSVSGLVRQAPIRWFEGGAITASVEDEWSLGEEDSAIEMDWKVSMQGVTVNVPEDAGAVERLTATALAKVVNGRADDVNFAFTLALDEEDFRNSASLDAADFWKALVSGVANAMAARQDRDPGKVEEDTNGATPGLKGLLERMKKDRD